MIKYWHLIYNLKNMRINKKDIFSIIVLVPVLAWVFYLSWLVSVIWQIVLILAYLFVFWLLYFLIKKIFRSKNITNPWTIVSRLLFIFSIFVFIIVWGVASLSYYFNEVSPAKMPEYTLTNWEKTVIFQWMIHIWGQKFYDQVKQNLDNYRKEWFTHFFEWVKPGKPENLEKLSKAMWVNFDKDVYKNMSELYWVVQQDYYYILWKITEKDINVDISLDEVIEEYLKIAEENNSNDVYDFTKILEYVKKNLNPREMKLLVYINQATLNLLLSNHEILEKMSWMWNKKIFDVIIWKRNEFLANEIQKSNDKKIYVTYWLLHFDWVLKLLQAKDPNWKIIGKKEYKIID